MLGRRTPRNLSLIRAPAVRQRLVANRREFLRTLPTQSFPRRQSFAPLFNLHSAAAVFALVWLGIAVTLADNVWAQRTRGAAPGWRTPSELAKHLEEPVTWSWSGQTLTKALAGLAETDRLPSFLDRRGDPGKKLEVAVVNTPLRQALGKAHEVLLVARKHRGVEAEFNAVGDRLHALRKLYGLLRFLLHAAWCRDPNCRCRRHL